MGIQKNNTYGIDLESFSEVDNTTKSKYKQQINYSIINKDTNYPFKNNYFRFISCFMVLHHIENLEFTLKEINRITKLNGFFILQEHDAFNIIDFMLCDIEHRLYMTIFSKNNKKTIKSNIKNYKAHYFNYIELDIILEKFGFEYVAANYFSPSINFNINDNRSFWAIYKKVKNI